MLRALCILFSLVLTDLEVSVILLISQKRSLEAQKDDGTARGQGNGKRKPNLADPLPCAVDSVVLSHP